MRKYAQLMANFQLAIIILMVSKGFKRFFHLQSRQIKIKNRHKISVVSNSIYKNPGINTSLSKFSCIPYYD